MKIFVFVLLTIKQAMMPDKLCLNENNFLLTVYYRPASGLSLQSAWQEAS